MGVRGGVVLANYELGSQVGEGALKYLVKGLCLLPPPLPVPLQSHPFQDRFIYLANKLVVNLLQ